MATYSLGTTGLKAGYVTPDEILDVPDDVSGTFGTIVVATVGGMANAMRQNLPMYVRGPDGGFGWYTFDAERSTPTAPILKAV